MLSDVLRPWMVVLNASLPQLGFSGPARFRGIAGQAHGRRIISFRTAKNIGKAPLEVKARCDVGRPGPFGFSWVRAMIIECSPLT